ncbi:MAG: hypothetical protein ACLGJB_17845 [Blastocatellia bacterium]
MFHTLISKLGAIIVAGTLSIAGLFGLVPKSQVTTQVQELQSRISHLQSQLAPSANLAGFNAVQAQKFKLAGAGITATDSSITLQSFKLADASTTLSMSDFGSIGYGTLEPGTSKEEQVSFTGVSQNGNGTAILTGVTRGLRFVSPYDSVSANKKAHAGGTIFVISNTSGFYSNFASLSNNQTFTAVNTFSSSSLPRASATPAYGSGSELYFTTKAYVDGVALAGAPDSSLTQKGLVEQATKAETAAGTATGGTTAPLVVPNSSFNATFSATTTVPVTGTNGKLSSGFIDQTAAYTWSATSTFSGPLITSGLSTGVLQGNSGSSVTSIAPSTSGNHLVSNGSSWTSASPALGNSSTTISTGGAMAAASFTVIATTTVTTNGFPVLLSAVGAWQNSGATNNNFLDFAVDGTRVGDSTGGIFSNRLEAASVPYSFNTTWIVPPLAAGSHTFTLLVKTSAGNITIPSNSSKATFFVKELY